MPEHPHSAGARDGRVKLAVRWQWPLRQWSQMRALLIDPGLPCRIASLDAALQKTLVRFARSKIARAAQPQALIDRALELTVGRLDIPVLVGVTREVARCTQPIVLEQLAVALGEIPAAAPRQFVRRRREVVGAMLQRHAPKAPKRPLQPCAQ